MPQSLYISAYVLLGLILIFLSMVMIVQGVPPVLVIGCLICIPYYRYLGKLWKRTRWAKTMRRATAPPSYS